MLFSPHYAKNYAGIIDLGLLRKVERFVHMISMATSYRYSALFMMSIDRAM